MAARREKGSSDKKNASARAESAEAQPEEYGTSAPDHAVDTPSAEEDSDGLTIQAKQNFSDFVTFKILGREYALRITDVEEILSLRQLTRVPRTRDFVLGIMSVRGKIVPVVDATRMLTGVEDSDAAIKGKVLLLKTETGTVGICIGKRLNIISILEHTINPPPSHLSQNEARFLEGVALVEDRFISVLNLQRMVSIKATGDAR